MNNKRPVVWYAVCLPACKIGFDVEWKSARHVSELAKVDTALALDALMSFVQAYVCDAIAMTPLRLALVFCFYAFAEFPAFVDTAVHQRTPSASLNSRVIPDYIVVRLPRIVYLGVQIF